MAGGNIKISPDEMREASTWLQNQKELMQQSLHEANTKMDEMVEAAYATPGSESKFRPYWEEYKNGTEKAIEGLQGVSEFIKQVADALRARPRRVRQGVGGGSRAGSRQREDVLGERGRDRRELHEDGRRQRQRAGEIEEGRVTGNVARKGMAS
ncbi:WXG100 family type VII secretion target [Streptomyces lydicus]